MHSRRSLLGMIAAAITGGRAIAAGLKPGEILRFPVRYLVNPPPLLDEFEANYIQPAVDAIAMQMEAELFEREYAARSGISVERLRELGRVVRPCHCGDEMCEGWQSINRELAEELEREAEHGIGPDYFGRSRV